jgi:hypothetical protein
VAKAVFELDQVPPASPLDVYVTVAPIHNGEVPETVPALALGLTVTDFCAETGVLQPSDTVYIILQVPAAIAVTKPVLAFTVANEVFELDQVPPASPLDV